MSIVPPAAPSAQPPTLTVGSKVKLAAEKRRWTVRAVTKRGRFAILTQPFNLQHTVLYAVIDFERGVRGRDNYYGLGYETDEEIADALHEFQHTEDRAGEPVVTRCADGDGFCRGGAEVSHRTANHIRLDMESIDGKPCEWNGVPA